MPLSSKSGLFGEASCIWFPEHIPLLEDSFEVVGKGRERVRKALRVLVSREFELEVVTVVNLAPFFGWRRLNVT